MCIVADMQTPNADFIYEWACTSKCSPQISAFFTYTLGSCSCIHLIAWSRTILSLWKQLASSTLFCIWYVDFHPILKTLKASKIIFPVFKGSLYTYFFLWFWSTWMLKNLYFSSCNKYSILVTYQKTLVVVNIITCVPLHVLSHIT